MSRPLFQTSWFDPTFVFATSTLFSVVFIEGKEEDQSFDLRPLSEIPAVLFDYVLDPVFFAGLVVLLAARHLVGDNAKPMTDSESRSAGWYLWNAVIIHVMMDGFAGGHWGNRLLAENYKLLDVRFKDSAHPAEAASACLIVNMELFFHSLLTVIAYVGVVTKSAWRYEAEIVALVVQLVGTFFFVLPEFMTGCLNMVRCPCQWAC